MKDPVQQDTAGAEQRRPTHIKANYGYGGTLTSARLAAGIQSVERLQHRARSVRQPCEPQISLRSWRDKPSAAASRP